MSEHCLQNGEFSIGLCATFVIPECINTKTSLPTPATCIPGLH